MPDPFNDQGFGQAFRAQGAPPNYGFSNSYKPPPAAQLFGYMAEHLQDPRVSMMFPGVGLGFRIPGAAQKLVQKAGPAAQHELDDLLTLQAWVKDYLGSNAIGKMQMRKQAGTLPEAYRNLIDQSIREGENMRFLMKPGIASRMGGMNQPFMPKLSEYARSLTTPEKAEEAAGISALDSVRRSMGWTPQQMADFLEYTKQHGQVPSALRPKGGGR